MEEAPTTKSTQEHDTKDDLIDDNIPTFGPHQLQLWGTKSGPPAQAGSPPAQAKAANSQFQEWKGKFWMSVMRSCMGCFLKTL